MTADPAYLREFIANNRDADPRELALEIAMIEGGICAECCIAEVSGRPHDLCAGPERYRCECYCEGANER